ncbi:hypothetical protein M9H77_23746 [Catharanthus roseus]|uniref:Uncharacterized protein n=1 Tax=Catharanthus roseus TaxID=4058 RepID=A0ACC0ATW5_CATRO|nr:hypothetical protein M9H77_23746 [Catharanthus roseus]
MTRARMKKLKASNGNEVNSMVAYMEEALKNMFEEFRAKIIQGNNLMVKMAECGRKETLPPTVGFYQAMMGTFHTYRRWISDEANRMWNDAKLRNRLVTERMVNNLLESQLGVLAYFWAVEWNTMVTMTEEYYPNLIKEFCAYVFFKSEPYKANIPTIVKGLGFI